MQLFKVVVQGAVIRNQDVLLFRRRGDHEYLGGYWETPGGAVETDESLEEACVREIAEEAGVVVRLGRAYHCFEYRDGRGQRSINIHFLAFLMRGQPRPSEDFVEFRWVKRWDLGTLKMTDEMRSAVEGAFRSLDAATKDFA